jgi:(S)-2-hydroxyglutarate dehydrogenase
LKNDLEEGLGSEQGIFDVVVVGGGIVGLASGWKIQQAFPQLKVLVLEKEDKLADHQTGHNSGVIHSGLYYKPGSYKARNCVEGRRELVAFAREHGIRHDVCGKVVVATHENEFPFMDKIFNNGIQNQVEGIERIGPDKIKEIEPYVQGIAGIWVPCTGIIDFRGVTEKLGELIAGKNAASKVLTGHEVIGVDKGESHTTVHTPGKSFKCKHVIFCGGLQCDRLARMDGVQDIGMKIVGFRGDYYDLTDKGLHKVRNLIYPIPNPAMPFLGVHFTRMVDGSTECGPNAVFVFKREGYGKLSFSLRDSFDALTYRGTWKLFFKHWRFGLDEYRRAFSKRLFLKRLQRLIPSLEMDDLKPGRAGVRAMALDPNGEMIDDFKIEYKENSIHVLNAPSPAATSALAIGTAVREMAQKHFGLN